MTLQTAAIVDKEF